MSATVKVRVKATPVNGLVSFVKEQLDAEQFKQLLDGVPEAEKRYFTGDLIANEQVDLEIVNRFAARAAQAKGESVFEFGHRAGRYGAEQGLRTVYKFILSLMSVGSVLRTAPIMWRKIYDGGQMTVEAGDGQATISVRDFPGHPAGCGRATGWFEVIGERSAEEITAKHSACIADGAPACVWEFTWKS